METKEEYRKRVKDSLLKRARQVYNTHDNKPDIIFTLEEIEYLQERLESSNEYWRKATNFVLQYIEGKAEYLTDKQYDWLVKIKIDVEARVEKFLSRRGW